MESLAKIHTRSALWVRTFCPIKECCLWFRCRCRGDGVTAISNRTVSIHSKRDDRVDGRHELIGSGTPTHRRRSSPSFNRSVRADTSSGVLDRFAGPANSTVCRIPDCCASTSRAAECLVRRHQSRYAAVSLRRLRRFRDDRLLLPRRIGGSPFWMAKRTDFLAPNRKPLAGVCLFPDHAAGLQHAFFRVRAFSLQLWIVRTWSSPTRHSSPVTFSTGRSVPR